MATRIALRRSSSSSSGASGTIVPGEEEERGKAPGANGSGEEDSSPANKTSALLALGGSGGEEGGGGPTISCPMGAKRTSRFSARRSGKSSEDSDHHWRCSRARTSGSSGVGIRPERMVQACCLVLRKSRWRYYEPPIGSNKPQGGNPLASQAVCQSPWAARRWGRNSGPKMSCRLLFRWLSLERKFGG
ncbi:hypothetical protein HYFRA_00011724 [Hymenoscyphus fraxineus]|uniref:Uncharacterized protein n=1 Tax=Hymenoscyphus fraxineus TaxID=746836 RepID=A0A9N9PLS3_9HELO|nr:hypothetical protein HYFRA_00011724 [Hymenoscyphus fraxineus]